MKRKLTPAQRLLGIHLKELGLKPYFEYLVTPDRKWRFDLACPEERLAFEVNGGRWTGGHYRGKAQDNEYDKLNSAQLDGWRVLQFTNEFVLKGRAKAWLEEYLDGGKDG